jgi:NAD(P)-dependent dehydrogenase (short-subunit alcohol dehydrogenase family)
LTQVVRREPHYTTARAVANDFEPGSNAGKRRYTTSKLCNLYCTYEYARRLAASSDMRLQSLRVNAFDPGLMSGTGLARTYSPAARFLWRYAMPALVLFDKSVYRPKTSARRLARLVSGGEILASGNTSVMDEKLVRQTRHMTYKRLKTFGTKVR